MTIVYNPTGQCEYKVFESTDEAEDWVRARATIVDTINNASSDFIVELIDEDGDVWGIK